MNTNNTCKNKPGNSQHRLNCLSKSESHEKCDKTEVVLLQSSLVMALSSSLEFPLTVELHNSVYVLEGDWQAFNYTS